MIRQHAIREYELFVSRGVQVVPGGVFDRDVRASGEYRPVRSEHVITSTGIGAYPGIVLGEATINLRTGEFTD